LFWQVCPAGVRARAAGLRAVIRDLRAGRYQNPGILHVNSFVGTPVAPTPEPGTGRHALPVDPKPGASMFPVVICRADDKRRRQRDFFESCLPTRSYFK
jgi:hypothetical protein